MTNKADDLDALTSIPWLLDQSEIDPITSTLLLAHYRDRHTAINTLLADDRFQPIHVHSSCTLLAVSENIDLSHDFSSVIYAYDAASREVAELSRDEAIRQFKRPTIGSRVGRPACWINEKGERCADRPAAFATVIKIRRQVAFRGIPISTSEAMSMLDTAEEKRLKAIRGYEKSGHRDRKEKAIFALHELNSERQKFIEALADANPETVVIRRTTGQAVKLDCPPFFTGRSLSGLCFLPTKPDCIIKEPVRYKSRDGNNVLYFPMARFSIAFKI